MTKLFPTYEIGSLPKLVVRIIALKADPSNPVTSENIADIVKYGAKTGVDVASVVEILEKQNNKQLSQEAKKAVIDLNTLLNLKLQEESGLDFVYDGEARRIEMYRHVARQINGFKDYPEMIRSRGPDSWRASICVAEPHLDGLVEDLHISKEFEFVNNHAKKPVKVPLDDPYMIVNMTGNQYYIDLLRSKYENPRELKYEAKRALTLALAENVIRPQVEAVVSKGAEWIQLDIPAATLDIEHIPIMVEGINAVVKNIDDVKFSLHICYPRRKTLTDKKGYELLFPHILDLDENVSHISLELANNDDYKNDLSVFAEYQDQRPFEIGLGVVDITLEQQQNGKIETPEIVRDRILVAANILGPNLIYVAPDCGLRQLSLERSLQLYDIIVKGAELARKG